MKQSLLAFSVLVVTSSASAACFNFVNGKGPQKIGHFQFAATSTKVCINPVDAFGRPPYTSVTFSDSQGALASFAGDVTANGRCPGFCKELTLTSGNINSVNVNISGTVLVIEAETDSHLGITSGVMKIKAGRDFPQNYLIINAK